jgi:hypothetical protein
MEKVKREGKPEDYVTTILYRDHEIDVFMDDYGQQYYFNLDGRDIGCGTYNFDYEDCVRYYVDEKLDHIEIIHNEKPHHPSAEVRWSFNQETGDRKKVVRYDGFVKELETQEGDYHEEVKKFMDEIDDEYDKAHQGEKPRTFFSDLMREFEEENPEDEDK